MLILHDSYKRLFSYREMIDIFPGIMPQHSTEGHIYRFLFTPDKRNLRSGVLFSAKKKERLIAI